MKVTGKHYLYTTIESTTAPMAESRAIPVSQSNARPALRAMAVLADGIWLGLLAASAVFLGYVLETGAVWRFDAAVCLAAGFALGMRGVAFALIATGVAVSFVTGAADLTAHAMIAPVVMAIMGAVTRYVRSRKAYADRSQVVAGLIAALAGSGLTALISAKFDAGSVAISTLTLAAVNLAVAPVVVAVALESMNAGLRRAIVAAAFVAAPAALLFFGMPAQGIAFALMILTLAMGLYCAASDRPTAAWALVAIGAVVAALSDGSFYSHAAIAIAAVAVGAVAAQRGALSAYMATQTGNRQLFESMMQFLPIGIFRSDTTGQLRYSNPAFQTLTGLGASPTQGWRDVVVAADRENVDAAWDAFTHGRDLFDQEFRLAPLGNVRWVAVRVTPEYEHGNVAGYIGTVTDITSQRIAEDARSRSEAHAQAVLDNAVDAIITIDESGTVRSFNKAAQRIFGYAANEVIGHSINMLMPAPHRERHDQYVKQYLHSGQAKIIGIGRELEALLKDGRRIPIHLSVSEVSLEGERHFTGMIRDISAERAAAEEIRRQHEQLSVTVQNAPMGIATYRFGHPFTAINRAFQLTTGFDQDRLRSMMLLDMVHVDDRAELERLMQQSAAGLIDQFALRIRIKRGDGTIVHLATHHAVTHDAAGNPDLIILQAEDLTGELQAIEAEREHRDKLTHVARLSTLGEMTAGIAHEINQPLTAIAMYAQSGVRMLDSGNPSPARLREALIKLNAQSLRAGAVIDRIQRLVRNRDGVREVAASNDLVTDILRLAESDARVNDAQIQVDLEQNAPLVRVDPIQIQQVLLNLVRNAIDAMRSIDYAYGNEVTICTRLTDDTVRISVIDTGTGVSADFAPQLFIPFATTKELGMGMGLSICRSIIEDHGGRLGYYNNDLHGATFYFDLPRETRDDE